VKLVQFILLTVATCVTTSVGAQTSTARALIESGTAAYVKDGASAAVAAWIKGSALEGNTQAVSQANGLRQIEDFYGKPVGSDVLREVSLSPKSTLVYFTINFQKGVLYARMQTYQLPGGGWVSTEFKFHTEATNILPSGMLQGTQ